MIRALPKIRSVFLKGHVRSVAAKKNILISFFIKGVSIVISITLIPMTINYVNPTQYGVWLTLSSIIGWFSFFDIGLGNGLKNKLAESIAKRDYQIAKIYVSTTYFLMILISGALSLIFLVVNHFVNWTRLLNTSPQFESQLNVVAVIVFFTFSFQFVFQLINIVSFANQKTTVGSLTAMLGNLLGIIIIFVLTKTTKGSLIYLCFSIGISPLLVLLIFSFILYNGKYRIYAPSWRFIDLNYSSGVLKLGVRFLFIQLGSLILFNTDNFIITQVIGPQAVTSYNIAFRYFSIVTMVSGIIMTPFWPAFTEANVRKDYAWVKSIIKRLLKMNLLLSFIITAMLMVSSFVYHYWIGNKVSIPFKLSSILAVYTCITIFRTTFYTYSYAVGKISVQLIMVFVSGLVNIPLGIFLGKSIGVSGVILSTTILVFGCGLVDVIQYRKLINGTAKGLWDK